MVWQQELFNFFVWVIFFYLIFWNPSLDCLDGFEGRGGAAETQILSSLLLMTSSFLFVCSGSFWWLQYSTVPIWSSIWFELNVFFLSHSEFNSELKRHGSGSSVRSKRGLHQSGTIWYQGRQSGTTWKGQSSLPAVLVMSIINYGTH